MTYSALIVDIVNSKKLLKEDREQLQILLKTCLEILNRIFKPSLEFEMIFSAGDEVQGLFRSPAAAFLYFRLFQIIFAPLQIRCGIGVGEWDVRIGNGTSAEQDGPAYHKAREAIANAHRQNTYRVIINTGNENDIIINSLANTSFLLTKRLNPYQYQILLLTELLHPFFDSMTMDLQAFTQLFSLVNHKITWDYDQNKTNKTNKTKKNFDLSKELPAGLEPFQIFSPSSLEAGFTLTTTFKKGLSKKIANITNTSRQNIDNVLKTANIAEIRRVDAVTLLLIHRTLERKSERNHSGHLRRKKG